MWVEKLRKLIESKVFSDWGLTPKNSIDFGDNSNDFKPPVDGSPWIRVSIDTLGTENAEVGTRFKRCDGFIVIQCFVAVNTGESFINQMLDGVSEIFDNENFYDSGNNLECFCMTPVYVGEKDNWYQKNAKVQFVYNFFN
jgi:hypothetical protein